MKIIILAMSCNKPDFKKEEYLVSNYWAKDVIENKYDDVSFYFYSSDTNERILNNYIYVNTGDEYFNTYEKTRRCFELLYENNIEFDYIIRTNLSTYLNIPLLLGVIKKYSSNTGSILTGEIDQGIESFLKKYDSIFDKKVYFGRGNLLILNKHHIETILKYDDEYIKDADRREYGYDREIKYTDDSIIGDIAKLNNITFIKLASTCLFEHHFFDTNNYRSTKNGGCMFKPSYSCAYISYKCFNKYIKYEFEEKACIRIKNFFDNHITNEEDIDKCFNNEY